MTMPHPHDPYRRDERDDRQLVDRFTQLFHRRPNAEELLLFRFAEARLHLRLPGRTRRRAAGFIATA